MRARRLGRCHIAAGAALLLAACAPATAGTVGGAPIGGVPQPASDFRALERAVLSELNAARTNPAAYAQRLEALLPHYEGLVYRPPGANVGIRTREGTAAVREASAALRATPARPAVDRSPGMSEGARDLVEDHGPRGRLGHTGSDGSSMGDRVNRYGQWLERITESIAYGPAAGAAVIQGLLIDDGVPDRGHRRNLLDPAVRVAGIACGRHATYGTMCVIDLAGGYAERQGGP